MQLVIGQQDGRTHATELDDKQANALHGLRVGQDFDGSAVGLDGYTLEITGGSDKDGFPMKEQLQGTARRKVLVTEGTGVKNLGNGERQRVSLRGNTVAEDIVQLNCKVVEAGDEDIPSLLGAETDEDSADADEDADASDAAEGD